MFPVEQSSFLHALGYAIGHSLWQMSILWLIYTGLIHLRQWSSSQRYNLAVSAATAGFAWFIITLFYYSVHINIQPGLADSSIVFAGKKLFTPAGNLIFFYHSLMATLRSLAPYFSCAYLIVMMMLSLRLANGFNQVKQLRTSGLSRASVNWRLFLKQHAAYLGIKKPVQLFLSNIAGSPLTVGFWKPIILIPIASINQLTPQQLEAVLLHELAHIRRHDYLFNILLQVVEIALFFNPFMRLLLKQARLERENSCDDYVLQFQYNAADYAKALLTIEQYSVESLLALGSNNQNEFQLLNRIKRMVAPERKAFNYRQQLGLLFLITLLGLGFTVISPKQQPVLAKVKEEAKQENLNSNIHKIIASSPVTPPPVDLIKNLENIKAFEYPASKELEINAKKIEAGMEKVGNEVNVAIQPHVKKIEANAMAIAAQVKEPFTGLDGLDIAGIQLASDKINKQISKIDWLKIIAPAMKESEKALASFPQILNDEWLAVSPAAPSPKPDAVYLKKLQQAERFAALDRKQAQQIEKMQAQLAQEQKKLSLMAGRRTMMADSLEFALAQIKNNHVLSFSNNADRARKAIAIAPYRQKDKDIAEDEEDDDAADNFQFNFNNNTIFNNSKGGKNDDEASQNFTILLNSKGSININKDGKYKEQKKPKTVVMINGNPISEKINQIWSIAKDNAGISWNEQVSKKLATEIEKELNQLEHVEIRTHIISKPESISGEKMIVIAIEAN